MSNDENVVPQKFTQRYKHSAHTCSTHPLHIHRPTQQLWSVVCICQLCLVGWCCEQLFFVFAFQSATTGGHKFLLLSAIQDKHHFELDNEYDFLRYAICRPHTLSCVSKVEVYTCILIGMQCMIITISTLRTTECVGGVCNTH